MSTTLSRVFKEKEIISNVYVDILHHYSYPGERLIKHFPVRFSVWLKEVLLADILHYNAKFFLKPPSRNIRYLELRLPNFANKLVVLHFHGSELRKPQKIVRFTPFFDLPILVAMPDLLKYVPRHAEWLPHPVDTKMFTPRSNYNHDEIIVGYYKPRDKYPAIFAGGRKVEEAVAELKELGESIKTKGAYLIPWNSMPEYYRSIDIWVDKTGLDYYGVSAVEAAACGVPVVAQIGEEALTFLPDCPFINVSHDRVRRALEYLSEENVRRYYGRKCRDYVLRLHCAEVVVENLLTMYKNM